MTARLDAITETAWEDNAGREKNHPVPRTVKTVWMQPFVARCLVGAVVLGLWPMHAWSLEYRDFTLDNGLRVVLIKESKAPVLFSQIWYRVGASDEVAGKTGLAHMLEHMMFQGTDAVPAGQFNRLVSQNGGNSNASTSHDYTNYFIKLASDRMEIALRLEADRMQHLRVAEKPFDSEKRVVQEERRTRIETNPNRRFLEKVHAKAYTDRLGETHPYGRPIIGWMADIDGLTLEDLRAWYQRYYAPDNAILVLVGDITLADADRRVRHHFADIPPRVRDETSDTSRRSPLPPYRSEAHDDGPHRIEVTDASVTLPLWYAGYPVPTLATEGQEDVFALDVLATILGGGTSSRLYRKLVVEEGLAVSVRAGYGGYARSWELFSISATPKLDASPPLTASSDAPEAQEAQEARHTLLARMEQAIVAEVARLGHEPVSERTLQRAKNSMLASHVFAQDSLYMIAYQVGIASVNGLDWREVLEGYPSRIKAVGRADVQRVAARYLKPERMLIGVLKP